MDHFRRLREFMIATALLVVPFFFLASNLKAPDRVNSLDRMILQASAPIQYLASETAAAISAVLQEYVYLVEVRRDNERLQVENAQLREDARQLRVEARENQRLRELLGLRERLASDTISARVISREFSIPFYRVMRIRIDRGERDFIRRGMPVVSTQGLVGQVHKRFGRYSDVLLTVDPTSAVDVVVQRTGAKGMLRGTGDNDRYACEIQYLQRTDELKVGDEVHTSGLGMRFPAAILVGTVTKITRKDFGLYQVAEVTPSVNFSNLDEVLVLTAGSREKDVREGSGGNDDGRQ